MIYFYFFLTGGGGILHRESFGGRVKSQPIWCEFLTGMFIVYLPSPSLRRRGIKNNGILNCYNRTFGEKNKEGEREKKINLKIIK